MRLTESIRSAFIRSVMNDVPCVDYTEQIRKIVVEDAVEALPPAVQKLWKTPATRDFVKTTCDYYSGVTVTYPSDVTSTRELSVYANEKVNALKQLRAAQRDSRDALSAQLKAVAMSVNTRKALALALPEFEKYLPADAEANRLAPVVVNVVNAFVEAGWPKEEVAA